MSFPGIHWAEALELLIKIVVAFLLAVPIAWDREKSTRIMGLRTFPIVAVASCSFVFVAIKVIGMEVSPQARVLQGLMTGVGFIGGGAIIKEGTGVRGTATAASIWVTGVVGVAVAYDYFELALLIGLTVFLTLRLLTPVEKDVGKEDRPEEENS